MRVSKIAAAVATVPLLLTGVAGVAVADDIYNNLDTSIDAVAEVMPLNVGGTNGSTTLFVRSANDDGKNGCNLTGSTTLVLSLSSSNTGVATVSPSSVTFTGCGFTQLLTVTPVAAGSATISASQTSNNTGGTFNLAPVTFTVNVTAAAPSNTAPVVTVAGVAGGATYNKGSVPAASCNVIDAEDGNSSFAATLSVVTGTYASDGIGSQTASCSYTDGGGLTASSSGTYSIVDPGAPVIGYTLTPSIAGGLNGWYIGDVSLVWSVNEPQSPNSLVKTGCVDQNVTLDQVATTYTCDATSAGGSATQVPVTIKRDATAPTFTATPSPAANGAGYNNGAVDVAYSCSDATSLLADTCPATDQATTDGTHVFAHTISDQAGNSSSISTTVKLDATKPTITGTRTAANGDGWNNAAVTVTFTCTDDGTEASGIKSCVADGTSPVSNEKTLSDDGANQSVSGTATDNADNTNSETLNAINIDTTDPIITFASRTPANLAGWNKEDVTVTWSCTDPGGSGAADATVSQTVTTEGAAQSASGTCTDLAGNTAGDTHGGINIDKIAPGIAFASATPAANLAGWNKDDVTVTFNCTDLGGSGAVSSTVSDTLTTEGAGQSGSGTCTDLAGNPAGDTHDGINIDKTAPEVAFTSASPAANLAGWNKDDVTASFTATDSLSGFVGPSVTETGTASTSGEGSGLTVDSPAFTDLAGNTAVVGTATSPGFDVDMTDPSVSLVGILAAVYSFGDAPAAPTCEASDALSDLDGSCVVTGGGTTVGKHSYTATATDNAGNQATATSDYTVQAWSLNGFFRPVDMGGVWNTVKGGSTVPLKFEVFSNSTELTNISAVDTFKTQKVSCAGGSGIEDAIEILSTGGTSLRYDSTGGQFIQNWKTPTGAGTCYSATMTTDDGSSLTALFKIK